jgi:DHA1 family inner membrane transport protein
MFGPIRSLYSLRPGAPPVVLAGVGSVTLMFSATPFLIAEIAERFGVTEGIAGGISVVQVGAFALVNVIVPRFAAPSGKVLRWSALTFFMLNLASVVAGTFWLLVALRLLAGAAAGAITWVAWADAMRAPRSLTAVSAVGPVIAMIGAPLVSAAAAGGIRAIYGVLAVAALPGLALRLQTDSGLKKRSGVSGSRSNRVLLASLFLLTFFGSSLFVFASVAARAALGLSAFATSWAFSMNALAGLIGARLAARHKRPGWWLASAGPAIALSITGGNAVWFFVGLTWWGFAFWMGLPGVLQMLAARSLAPDERAGDAQGLLAMGRAIGPILGGGLTDAGAFSVLAVVAGTGVTAAGLSVVGVQEGRDRLPPSDSRFGSPRT